MNVVYISYHEKGCADFASVSAEEAGQIIRNLYVPAPMAPVAARTGRKYRNKKAKQAGRQS